MIRPGPAQDARQLDFESYAVREMQRCRRTDPQTSKDAAADSHGLVAVHTLLILQAMRDGGERDWTAHELAAACSLTPEQVNRRLRRMWRDGLIFEVKVGDVVQTRETSTGRRAGCWRNKP